MVKMLDSDFFFYSSPQPSWSTIPIVPIDERRVVHYAFFDLLGMKVTVDNGSDDFDESSSPHAPNTSDALQDAEGALRALQFVASGGDPSFRSAPQSADESHIADSAFLRRNGQPDYQWIDIFTNFVRQVLAVDATDQEGLVELLESQLFIGDRDKTQEEVSQVVRDIQVFVETAHFALMHGTGDKHWRAIRAAAKALRNELNRAPENKMQKRWQILQLLERARTSEPAAQQEHPLGPLFPEPTEIGRLVTELTTVDGQFLNGYEEVENAVQTMRQESKFTTELAATKLTRALNIFGDQSRSEANVRKDFDSARRRFASDLCEDE